MALVRVPQLGTLTVAAGGTVTTSAWNGLVGGVLPLRAAKLVVNGAITVSKLGYRNGRWSRDDATCDDNVATESGESIGGPPVGNGRTVGDPGVAYGAADGSKLTLGSGASGNLTCENGFAGPALVEIVEPLAGGIVAIFADRLDVNAGGSIDASAAISGRDDSAAGGYVFISGTTLSVGTNLVTSIGGVGNGSGVETGQTVKSGDGYVVLKGTTVTGTTMPAAH